MSRVGKRPIAIPQGVSVNVAGASVQVKGPKGQLSQAIPAPIRARVDGAEVKLERPDDRQDTRSLHGLARALVANMIRGVTAQFSKELEIQGVGYRAEAQGKKLTLQVGFSHPVVMEVPQGEALPASSIVYGKTAVAGKPTAYVCLGPQCSPPVTEAAELAETVRAARRVTVA